MSFGVSLGDIIALGNLAERIAHEVNSYHSAPLHFQRLSIEIGFISKLCSQMLELEPSSPSERNQLERIRVIAIQCLGPIRAFEEKMREYDDNLGAKSWENEVGGVKQKFKSLKKRLHWSLIRRKEVDELRAILASEMLAMNTIISTYEWESLKTIKESTTKQTEQLTAFICTVESATKDIQRTLLQTIVQSTRLEELLHTGRLSSEEQVKILKHIIAKSTACEELAQETLAATSSQARTINQIAKTVKDTVVSAQWVRRKLEKTLKAVIQYGKALITIVDRNTRILVRLERKLGNLETKIMQRGISLPILVFKDPFGEVMALPWQVCDTLEGLKSLAIPIFLDGLSKRKIRLHPFIVVEWVVERNGRTAALSFKPPGPEQRPESLEYITCGDHLSAKIRPLFPFQVGRRCYCCLTWVSDEDLRSSKCVVFLVTYSSACNHFLFQLIPFDETGKTGILSGLWADNQTIIELGITGWTLGYSLVPESIYEPLNGFFLQILEIYYKRNEKLRRQERQKRISYLAITSICALALSRWLLLGPHCSIGQWMSFLVGYCISVCYSLKKFRL